MQSAWLYHKNRYHYQETEILCKVNCSCHGVWTPHNAKNNNNFMKKTYVNLVVRWQKWHLVNCKYSLCCNSISQQVFARIQKPSLFIHNLERIGLFHPGWVINLKNMSGHKQKFTDQITQRVYVVLFDFGSHLNIIILSCSRQQCHNVREHFNLVQEMINEKKK